MSGEPGLRERKKQQTRQAIAAAAFELFAEHGFERVPVTEIARRAGVSEATVFNYFPAKEDLVHGRMEEFGARLVEAVRDRPPGEPPVAAFRRHLLSEGGLLRSPEPGAEATLRTVSRIIAESPALLARERQVHDETAQSLAQSLAAQGGTDPHDIRPQVVAHTLMGVHRTLVRRVRDRVLAGDALEDVARDAHAQAGRALTLLEEGLAGWDVHMP
jgi:AcrR family transcriptional regulator